jgi:hypothetical protein
MEKLFQPQRQEGYTKENIFVPFVVRNYPDWRIEK